MKKGVDSRQVVSKEEVDASKMEFQSAIGVKSKEASSKEVDKLVVAEEEEVE